MGRRLWGGASEAGASEAGASRAGAVEQGLWTTTGSLPVGPLGSTAGVFFAFLDVDALPGSLQGGRRRSKPSAVPREGLQGAAGSGGDGTRRRARRPQQGVPGAAPSDPSGGGIGRRACRPRRGYQAPLARAKATPPLST